MPATIQINVNKKLHLRDPDASALGRKILGTGIRLIDELGFQNFTLKKLATEIESTEASMYRYFESKHQLLSYLIAWYWGWLEYRLSRAIENVEDGGRKLKKAIEALSSSVQCDPAFPYIDESILHRVVIRETGRALSPQKHKDDSEHSGDAFESLCEALTAVIKGVRPRFKYPRALALTLIATTHRQHFYAEHFPTVTDVTLDGENTKELAHFLEMLAFSVLEIRA